MSWEAVGAVGEILGAIAVLDTLVYLATQVKQSNDLARFNASKELVNQFNEINRLVATDASLRRLLMKTGELSSGRPGVARELSPERAPSDLAARPRSR